MEYPPNSKKVTNPPEEKKVERVTSADAVRRKKPLGKQFKNTFFSGNAKTALHYAVVVVLLPAAKDNLVEAVNAWTRSLILGEQHKRGVRGPPSGHMGYVNYNQQSSSRPSAPAPISRRARAQHDFDEIVLSTRAEAEDVIDRLFDLVSQWGQATVADLYALTGLPSTHVDHRWGWTDMRGSSVTRVRSQGYLLDLPDPEPLA